MSCLLNNTLRDNEIFLFLIDKWRRVEELNK